MPRLATVTKASTLFTKLARELEVLTDWCYEKGVYYLQMARKITGRYQQCQNCLNVLPTVFTKAVVIPSDNDGPQLVLNINYRKCKMQQERFPFSLAQQCADMGNQLIAISNRKVSGKV